MCFLDDVVLGVQAPYNEPLQEAAARSFLVVLALEITTHLIMKWLPLFLLRRLFFISRWKMRR